jgi:hypothetical protein
VRSPITFVDFSLVYKCLTNDDRFPLSLWEVWFWTSLGVPSPGLIGPSQQCPDDVFLYDSYGDHLQTCPTKSEDSQVHSWVGGWVSFLTRCVTELRSTRLRQRLVKNGGDIDIKSYVVLQKPQEQDNRFVSSYLDHGFQHESYLLWTVNFSPYRTTYSQKVFRWFS